MNVTKERKTPQGPYFTKAVRRAIPDLLLAASGGREALDNAPSLDDLQHAIYDDLPAKRRKNLQKLIVWLISQAEDVEDTREAQTYGPPAPQPAPLYDHLNVTMVA
jgi:hypothetical protein